MVHGACPAVPSHGDNETSPTSSDVSGGASTVSVVRIRGPDDMKYVTDYLRCHHEREYCLLEQSWEKESPLNEAECQYVKRVVSQLTPHNFSRFVLVGLFLVVVFIRGCTYWGWNGLQDLLYKSGAFAWRCDPTSAEASFQEVGSEKYLDCPQRKHAINDLYTAAFASNFIFSAVGGMILDRIGPKLTLSGAILVDAAGWTLLAVASETVVSYVPALVFIGMAADPGYLPLLCIANLFPNKESTVMGVMGSVRSLSFAVPVIMAEVYKSSSMEPGFLWKVLVVYIVAGLGICLIICLLFVPREPFLGAEDFRRMEREEQLQTTRQQLLSSLPPSFFSRWARGDQQAEQHLEHGEQDHQGDHCKLILTEDESGQVLKVLATVEKHAGKMEREATLGTALMNPLFLLLLPVFVVNLLRVEFYTKSNKEQLTLPDGRNLYGLFSTMNILSFLPGPVMGYLSDRLGTLFVLTLLNVAGIGMYALLMPINLASKGVSIFFFWIYASFVLSSVYCYIKKHFPNKLFGSLAGICSLVGGCFALTSIGWYKLSTDTLLDLKPRNFWPVNGVMIGGGLLVCFVLVFLFALEKRGRKSGLELKEDRLGPADIESPPGPSQPVEGEVSRGLVGGCIELQTKT